MAELEELQKRAAELTAQMEKMKAEADAMKKQYETAQADLKSAREANAVLVTKIPGIMKQEDAPEPPDTRTPDEMRIEAVSDFVDAVYMDRFAPKEEKA